MTFPKRPITSDRPYQVCSRCVMDTSDTNITFDQSGVCDHCHTFDSKILPKWQTDEKGKAILNKLVSKIKSSGTSNTHDCIIGMSGGIDSSYLVYVATQLGLRPLVFHVDAGWNTPEAVNNIEKIVDTLGLDLYTEVINWDEMRDLQLSFFKAGVPHVDAPQDHAFFATMYKFAEKYNIKYILTGANYSTECIRNPIEWMYYQSDSVQLLDIHRRFGSIKLSSFPTTSILRHKFFLPYVKRIKVVHPLNYLNYHKGAAAQLLADKFGWLSYPQKHFESRFTRFYEGFWLPYKFGYDTRKVQFSSLILTHQMSRDDALLQLQSPPLEESFVLQEFDYVATKLGISPALLREFLYAPNKSYKDYKSQQSLYNAGRHIMQFFKLELGGKR